MSIKNASFKELAEMLDLIGEQISELGFPRAIEIADEVTVSAIKLKLLISDIKETEESYNKKTK